MRNRLLFLGLIVSLVGGTALFSSKAGETSAVALPVATRDYLFGCSGNGQVVWKIPLTKDFGVESYTWGPRYVCAFDGKRIRVLSLATGNRLWEARKPAGAQGAAFEGDTLKIRTGNGVKLFDARTGRRLGQLSFRDRHQQVAFLVRSQMRRPCGMPVCVEQMGDNLLAFDQNARRLWVRRFPAWRFLGTTLEHVFLSKRDSVQVLDLRNGHRVWARGFQEAIKYAVIGSHTEVHLQDGRVLSYVSKTGEPIRSH